MARYDERARYRNGMAEDRFGDRYGRESMGAYESGHERMGGSAQGRSSSRMRGRAGDEPSGPARGVYGHGGFDEGGEVDESGSGRRGYGRQGWDQGDYGQQDWGPGGFDRERPGGMRPGFRGDWDRGRTGERERLSGPARGVYGHGGYDEGGEVRPDEDWGDQSRQGMRDYGGQGWDQGGYGQQSWGRGGYGPRDFGQQGARGYGGARPPGFGPRGQGGPGWDQGDYGRQDWSGQGYDQSGYGRPRFGGVGREDWDQPGFAGTGSGGYGRQGQGGPHAGRGPRGYQRSDDRIREEISERLTEHPDIDPGEVDVQVQGGEVTLTGTAENRWMKRMIEDVADSVSGVKEVHNQIRLARGQQGGQADWHVTTPQATQMGTTAHGPRAGATSRRGQGGEMTGAQGERAREYSDTPTS
jgi:hypothetical protein